MTYLAQLAEDGRESNHLAVLKPRRKIISTTWVNVTGTVYYAPFAWGDVIAVTSDGVAKTLGTSTSPSSGEWFWDAATSRLYINIGANPDTKTVIATYELYVATRGVQWHRIPTDTSTRIVYFEPFIISKPTLGLSAADAAFGFFPAQSSSMTLSNAEHFYEDHVSKSSFSNVDIDLYHWVDDVDAEPVAANIKFVYSCLCQGVTYDDSGITIEMIDRNNALDTQYRSASTGAFFSFSAFPALDPAFENKPIRQVYGPVEGFIGVNIDFDSESMDGTKNRDWVIMKGAANLSTLTKTVVSIPSPDVLCWITLDSVDGLVIGDTVCGSNTGGLTDFAKTEGGVILDIDVPGKRIQWWGTNLLYTWDSNPITTITRCFVPKITYLSQEVTDGKSYTIPYELTYGYCYLTFVDVTNDVAGIVLKDNFEGSIDCTKTQAGSTLYFSVRGHANTTTLGGSAFGATDASGSLTQAVVVLFDLLKTLGIPESKIDTTVFTALQASITDQVGFAIPKNSTDDFPLYRDLLAELLQTLLLKMFVDFDGKWTVTQLAPMGVAAKTVSGIEIMNASLRCAFNYREILSRVQIEYALREIGSKHVAGNCDRLIAAADSNNAKWLHGIEKQQTFQSMHFVTAEAQVLANRLMYFFGERQGRFALSAKNRFFDSDLSDVIEVSREALPGYPYVEGTNRTASGVVVGTSKSLDGVALELDDQKGVEDNAGSW